MDKFAIAAGVSIAGGVFGGLIAAILSDNSKNKKPQNRKSNNTKVGKVIGKGFQNYSFTDKKISKNDLKPEEFKTFILTQIKNYGINDKEAISNFIEISLDCNRKEKHLRQILFDDGKGTCKWMVLMSSRNDNGTYAIGIYIMDQTFELEPDILVYKDFQLVDGKLQGLDIYREKMPKSSLTAEDLEQLFNLFEQSAYKVLASEMNIAPLNIAN